MRSNQRRANASLLHSQHLQDSVADAGGPVVDDLFACGRRRPVEWESAAAGRVLRPITGVQHAEEVSVPVVSPDESRIVVARKDLATNNNDLWLTDALGTNPVRFTFDSGSDLLGLWSPDGRRIIWSSTRDGSFDLYEKEVNGTGRDTPLLRSAEPKFPLDWSRDGRYLLYRRIDSRTGHDIKSPQCRRQLLELTLSGRSSSG